MRVAFPTNNLKTLAPHTALSKYIAIVEINNKTVTERIAVKNPIPLMAKETPSEEQGRGLGSGRIISQILSNYDVKLFIANEIGDGMKTNLEYAGIKVFETQTKDIKKIIETLLEEEK